MYIVIITRPLLFDENSRMCKPNIHTLYMYNTWKAIYICINIASCQGVYLSLPRLRRRLSNGYDIFISLALLSPLSIQLDGAIFAHEPRCDNLLLTVFTFILHAVYPHIIISEIPKVLCARAMSLCVEDELFEREFCGWSNMIFHSERTKFP